MKKILFYIYSLNKGGAERVLVNLCSKLKESYEVVILTDAREKKEYVLPDGVRRICIEEVCGNGNAVLRLQAIRKICRQEQASLVIAFMISSAIRAVLANLFTNNKVMAAVRSNPYDEYGSGMKRLTLNLIAYISSGVICQTDYQKEYFWKVIRKKTVVILNPLTEEFTKRNIQRNPDRRIVTVGRLYDYKNHTMLIRAFSAIAGEFPDTTLYLYGDGPYKENTRLLIENLNLEARVFLPGDVDDVANCIKNAALFVLPSDTEGLPNALMEAMALEIPCIATDCPCGGPKTLITEGINGYLCGVNQIEELAGKMRILLRDNNKAEQIGKNAGKIREYCSIDRISKEWREWIEKNT